MRTKTKVFIAIACSAVMSVGCKARQDSEAKAIYQDPKFTAGESKTMQRLPTLSRFANDLLGQDEVKWIAEGTYEKTGKVEPLYTETVKAFTHNGIDPGPLLPLNKPGNPATGKRGNYLLFLEQGSKDCFFLEGFFDKKIESQKQLDDVLTQLRSVARFLKNFHIMIDGDVDQGFVPSRIELCSKSYWNDRSREMEWMGNGHLRINIPASAAGWGTTYRQFSADKLMKIWQAGDIFVGDGKVDSLMKNAWIFLNPASDKRRELVKIMRKTAGRVLQKLLKLTASNQTRWPDGAKIALGETVSADSLKVVVRSEVDGAILGYKTDEAIDEIQQANKTDEFLAIWREFLQNPNNHDAIINAAPIAVNEKRVVDVKNVAISLIGSVSNVHDISVKVSVAAGKFSKYIRVAPQTENLTKIRQYCISVIAAVCTVDKVEAFVDVILKTTDMDRALATAGFDEAVRQTIGPRTP